MWTSIIGGALGALGSAAGAWHASEAARKAKAGIEAQRASNQAWYDRNINMDATGRADAQRAIARTQDMIRANNKSAAATAAVMGGTEESVAATKAANARAMADAAADIAVAGEARRDQVEQAYRQQDAALQGQLNNLEMQRASAIGQAAQGVANIGAQIAGTDFSKKEK